MVVKLTGREKQSPTERPPFHVLGRLGGGPWRHERHHAWGSRVVPDGGPEMDDLSVRG